MGHDRSYRDRYLRRDTTAKCVVRVRNLDLDRVDSGGGVTLLADERQRSRYLRSVDQHPGRGGAAFGDPADKQHRVEIDDRRARAPRLDEIAEFDLSFFDETANGARTWVCAMSIFARST
jgi:hypothetical protein